MAGEPQDYDLYMSENGHLSFENPNYQHQQINRMPLARIDAARMEDHLNSNVVQPSLPPSVLEEFRQVALDSPGGSNGASAKKHNRKGTTANISYRIHLKNINYLQNTLLAMYFLPQRLV